jgi:hypothetical protein
MGHRCRDDFWMWAAIAVAAANDNSCRSSCCCDERPRDRYDYDRTYSYSSDRAASPTQNPRKPVLVVAAVGVVLVLFAILVFNSRASDSGAQPIRPAPSNFALTPAETRSEAPIEQASAPAAEQPVVESAPTAEAEPPPLVAANLVALDALVPSLESNALDSLFFDVGSSRAEVVAAQGRQPTYAAHHDRTLWWGSSRVEFDGDGRVRSWVDGTPSLNVYKR